MSGAKINGNKPLNKRRGDCAEYLAEKKMENRYKNKGYDHVKVGDEKATDVLTNGSGHGLDHLMMDGDGNVLVGETKANSARLSKLQEMGPGDYLQKQIEDMVKGLEKGEGRYKNLSTYSDKKKAGIRETLMEMEEARKDGKVKGEVNRVPLKPDEGKNAYTPKEDKNRCDVAKDKEIKVEPW